ncbi:MAG: carboxylesterase family protein [Ketobacter sp.]|nr:MAG: carboxylesterase family protein [Ketobacter sp.]
MGWLNKPVQFSAVISVVFLLCACNPEVQVDTTYGTLAGKDLGEVNAFLGIPYAQPPVGDLRWADPQPAQPWEGVRPAKLKGDACTQYGSGLPIVGSDEDCLTLNIWTPNTPGPHPVMFWVHGGAQMSGSSAELQYDGAKLAAAQDVVLVSVNYRLLVSGFFATPALGSEPALSGNQAIKDLILALQWVQSEIHLFGGDPDNVTVFGESAGSTNTCALLATPKTKSPQQLLHKVIMQSGACDTLGIMSLAQARQIGLEFIETLGCADAPEPLQCARDLPIAAIREPVKTNLFTAFGWRQDEWPFQIGLVVDGDVFPRSPLQLLSESAPQIPLILGTNKDEGSLFAGFLAHPDDAAGYLEFMQSRYPVEGAEIASQYPFDDYDNAGSAHAAARGDMIMKCPTLNMARLYSEGNPVWMYSLEEDVQSVVFSAISLGFKRNAPQLGTFHTADIGYLFDFPLLSAMVNPSDREVRRSMQQYWGNFARTGNPNGEGVLPWQGFDSAQNNYLEITGEPVNRENFRQGACDYWFAEGYGF